MPTLLDYLPFADADHLTDEVGNALTALAVKDGQPDKALVAALASKEPPGAAWPGSAVPGESGLAERGGA